MSNFQNKFLVCVLFFSITNFACNNKKLEDRTKEILAQKKEKREKKIKKVEAYTKQKAQNQKKIDEIKNELRELNSDKETKEVLIKLSQNIALARGEILDNLKLNDTTSWSNESKKKIQKYKNEIDQINQSITQKKEEKKTLEEKNKDLTTKIDNIAESIEKI